MKRFLFASLAVAALSVAAVLCWWLWHVGHQTQTTVASYQHVASGAVTAEKAATEALQQSSKALESARELLKAARATIASYEGRSQAWEALAQREMAALRGQLVWAQMMEVRPVRDAAVQALASVPPAVSDTRRLIVASESLVTKATPQTIGLIAGWKQTGGFSAQTLRMVQPSITATLDNTAKVSTDIARVSPTVTANVEKTSGHVEKMLRPASWIGKALKFVVKIIF